MLLDSDELKRTRRFNSLGKEEGMAFYRPTKHNSLFFISSSENSPKFQATEVQEKRFSSSHGGAVNPASMQIQNSSTIDRSDHLTVRSVSEEQQSWVSGYAKANTCLLSTHLPKLHSLALIQTVIASFNLEWL